MALQKIVDSMRDVTVVDAAKITTGAVPTAALSNVDLVEGTKGADIASAGTMVIGTDGGYFDITGTTGISTMTVAAGRVFTLQFDGVVTLTHSATLYLSGAANFTTEANDHMTFISVAANSVRQIGTGLKDGGSPIAAAGGKLVQVVNVNSNAFGSTTTPSGGDDDTIPAITEGAEAFNVAITPTNASNLLLIQIVLFATSASASVYTIVTLHRDAITNALGAVGDIRTIANAYKPMALQHWMTAGTTSAITFRVRYGQTASGTAYLNGRSGNRRFGDIQKSSMTIMEIEA